MDRTSRKNLIFGRLSACRRILNLKLDTQRLRVEIVKKLRDIFNDAHFLAKNRAMDLREREKWARVAAYAAQTIDGLCLRFDEREVDEDLSMLKRLINEAKAKNKDKDVEQRDG